MEKLDSTIFKYIRIETIREDESNALVYDAEIEIYDGHILNTHGGFGIVEYKIVNLARIPSQRGSSLKSQKLNDKYGELVSRMKGEVTIKVNKPAQLPPLSELLSEDLETAKDEPLVPESDIKLVHNAVNDFLEEVVEKYNASMK